MSCEVIYTCDYCNTNVSPYAGEQWPRAMVATVPNMPDLHACSKEHMGLALAKAFGLPMDNNTLRLVTEKNDALNAARAAIIECDNIRARLSKLEAQNHHAGELLAKAQARVAELEQAWDMLKKSLDESDLQRNEGLAKIADLEKRLAEATAPLTVDGKTPGQVDYESYTAARFGANADSFTPWHRLGSDFQRFNEAGAQSVLHAFGPALTKQAAVNALGRVRQRITHELTHVVVGDTILHLPGDQVLRFIEAELAKLDAPKPASDHTHELGSCSFCDKPETITIPTKPTKPLVAFTEVELAKIDEYHQRQPRCPLWTYLEMSVELFDEKRAAGQLDFAQRRIRA